MTCSPFYIKITVVHKRVCRYHTLLDRNKEYMVIWIILFLSYRDFIFAIVVWTPDGSYLSQYLYFYLSPILQNYGLVLLLYSLVWTPDRFPLPYYRTPGSLTDLHSLQMNHKKYMSKWRYYIGIRTHLKDQALFKDHEDH